jgi:hypothetical protein
VSPLDTGAYAPDFRAWPVGEEQDARSSVDAASGEYHLALRRGAPGYVRYAGEEHSFADFVVEVDARRVAGADQGGYGLAFRYQPPGRAGTAQPRFVFYVTPAGSFALYLVTANSGRQVLQPEQPSPAIKRGDAANHLAVTCRGGTIVLAINGQTVGVYSTALVTAGEVGLAVVNADQNDSTEAAFSNLRVVPLR